MHDVYEYLYIAYRDIYVRKRREKQIQGKRPAERETERQREEKIKCVGADWDAGCRISINIMMRVEDTRAQPGHGVGEAETRVEVRKAYGNEEGKKESTVK